MITYNSRKVFGSFPNGESLMYVDTVKAHTNDVKTNLICLRYEDDRDLIRVMLLKEYLDSKKIKCELLLPYVPYSRMDRVECDAPLVSKYVCNFINKLNFDRVHIVDPHSDVCSALLNNVEVHFVTPYLFSLISNFYRFNSTIDHIFFPDAGAMKRYGKMFNSGYVIFGNKSRDFATGNITNFEVIGKVNPGSTVFIIDDLCSKGGTFVLAAEKLVQLGASHCVLVVAHCENTYLDGAIQDTRAISKVVTTDSIFTAHDKLPNPTKLTAYPVIKVYNR